MEEKRPKPLPPTLRGKQRYIAYQIISEQKIPFSDLVNSIWHSLLNFLGERGTAEANIWIVKNTYEEDKQIGLLRCSHRMIEHVRSALALIQRIGDTKVVVKVLGVSGTMKAARKKFFGETDLKDFT
ncbi:MAG: Rpp14/Pop5 family protein [Candidatus Aenigmatarchaeota archaeon]